MRSLWRTRCHAGVWRKSDRSFDTQSTTEATMKGFVLAVMVLFALGAGAQASAEDEASAAVSQDTAVAPDSPAMATDTSSDQPVDEPSAESTPAASEEGSK
jgi:hypothetical protein